MSDSELLEDIEEIFPWYYIDGSIVDSLKSSTPHWCVIVAKGLKESYPDDCDSEVQIPKNCCTILHFEISA